MSLGIRARALAWLTIVVLPFLLVGWLTIELIESRLTSRIELDLANARRLEAARIVDALDQYERDGRSLAAGPHVVEFVGRVTSARQERLPAGSTIGGYDGFDEIDPDRAQPLDQLVAAVQAKAQTTGSEVIDLAMVGPDGSVYGQTDAFAWQPTDPGLIDAVLADGRPRFGDAFRASDGSDRLGHVVPVIASRVDAGIEADEVVGVLVLETALGPIVDLVVEHEGFGDTSEAHIAQPTVDGDAEFITLLRFERDAAFTKVVPKAKDLPINWSLESPGGRVVRSPDYRGIDSILAIETIDATGWGLVVKIDAAETLAPVTELRRIVVGAATTTAGIVVLFSVVMVKPLTRRIHRLSLAARQMAAGDYESRIDDNSSDELGQLARSIDRLAGDLGADIELRNSIEAKLRHQVTHDGLTGINNRHFAERRLADLVDEADGRWSVLFLDLDGFKPINDTFGHGVGDEVLQLTASRLQAAAPVGSLVARWGGDEFIVVLPNTDHAAALALADTIEGEFREPLASSAATVQVGCSIGVATATPGHSTVADVLRQADAAMFARKPKERERRRAWSTGERAVMAAMDECRIEVWYQPLVELDGSQPVLAGAEALVRMRDDGRILTPDQFLDAVVAGEVGADLDRHVLERAAADTVRWQEAEQVPPGFELSVNIGPASARDPRTASTVVETLRATGLRPESLVLELSEAADAVDHDGLEELAARGIKLAIDDVGVSRSNFDRLLRLQPTYAKLDRRWFLGAGGREGTVLDGLIGTVRALGLTLVAEGIEGQAQLDLVLRLGVTRAQGYLFSRPVPANEFEARFLAPAIDHELLVPAALGGGQRISTSSAAVPSPLR